MDYTNQIEADFARLAHLSLGGKSEDLRLFLAKLALHYRKTHPDLAHTLENQLKESTGSLTKHFMRGITPGEMKQSSFESDYSRTSSADSIPLDNDTRLKLLKIYRDDEDIVRPILPPSLVATFEQIFQERENTEKLLHAGLLPTRSAVFIGPPGVGKTLTARWIASRLGYPLYILDLTVVMSSYLGKTGANLRTVLDFAKETKSVLLLDEIDAIAKKRDDFSDVGELKRLVTVMLQEIDNWPASSLLLAATNFSELVDPAIWRRFDMTIDFPPPDKKEIHMAILRFWGSETESLGKWIDSFAILFKGCSFSDIEKAIYKFRKILLLNPGQEMVAFRKVMQPFMERLDKPQTIELAKNIHNIGMFSQHDMSSMLGMSRDTIRKYCTTKNGTNGDVNNGK